MEVSSLSNNIPNTVQSVTELKPECTTVINEETIDVIDKLASQIDAMELLAYKYKQIESKVLCNECQRSCIVNQEVPNSGKGNKDQVQEVNTITVGSVSNYALSAKIGGVAWVSFLVDTGAAVSLIDAKVWDSIKPLKHSINLNSVTTRLGGVD